MTPSTVPDTSADPAADAASPTRPGTAQVDDLPPLSTPGDAGLDETAPLRAAVHATSSTPWSPHKPLDISASPTPHISLPQH